MEHSMDRLKLIAWVGAWAASTGAVVFAVNRTLHERVGVLERDLERAIAAVIDRDEALASQIRLLTQPNLSERAGYFPDQDPDEMLDWAWVWWYDVREQRVVRTRSELRTLIDGPIPASPGTRGELGAGYLQLLADAGRERAGWRQRDLIGGLDDGAQQPDRER
jgi:hypothetical protein